MLVENLLRVALYEWQTLTIAEKFPNTVVSNVCKVMNSYLYINIICSLRTSQLYKSLFFFLEDKNLNFGQLFMLLKKLKILVNGNHEFKVCNIEDTAN